MPADIVIDDGTYAAMEGSVYGMSALETVPELSDAIMDRLNDFRDQHDPQNTTYDNLSLLAQAAVGLEILRQLPVADNDVLRHKQDALICLADNVGGYFASTMVHKDQVGIPEAKVVYDRLVEHGIDTMADVAEQHHTETFDL